MNLQPLGDRIVIKKNDADECTPGGLIIPDIVKEKPQLGTVKAAGPGRLDEKGVRHNMEVKVGDQILFAKYVGSEIKLDGEDFLILSERDVLAVVE